MSEHLTVNKQWSSLVASTPSQCVKDLVTVLYGGQRFGNHVDEVWPNLFIGDMWVLTLLVFPAVKSMGTEHLSMRPAYRSAANDRFTLWKLGITHVVNVAHGSPHSQGSRHFYGPSVDYYGVAAHDSPSFDLSCHFVPSADYIQKALDGDGGKSLYFSWHVLLRAAHPIVCLCCFRPARVLVHCAVGVSRSASLVLAYLMVHHGFTLLQAINQVKEHRWIFPNRGFLKQLQALEMNLQHRSWVTTHMSCVREWTPVLSSFIWPAPQHTTPASQEVQMTGRINIGQRPWVATEENDRPKICSSTTTSSKLQN